MEPRTIISDIIDLILQMPKPSVRDLKFLEHLDWSKVEQTAVHTLFAHLSSCGIRPGDRLLAALLRAGRHLSGLADDGSTLYSMNELLRMIALGQREAAWQAHIERLQSLVPEDAEAFRQVVRVLVRAGFESHATKLALRYWRRMPEAVAPVAKGFSEYRKQLEPLKISLLAFSTAAFFAEELAKPMAAYGYNVEVTAGEFGQVLQPLISGQVGPCDALVILFDADGLFTVDWRLDADKSADLLHERMGMLVAAIERHAAQADAPILLNTLARPDTPSVGVLDNVTPAGAGALVNHVNQRLAQLAGSNPKVFLVDTDLCLADLPTSGRRDEKLWYYGRIAYSNTANRLLAAGFADVIRSLRRGPAKVLALDLDNTLWGGIYGEDGMANLQCGDDFPGNAFLAFQKECLRLKAQGFLLVILSKNNPDALTVFSGHVGMALKESDFVAHRINWSPKGENIREIALELNLGLSSFIFIDDSPHERAAMRKMCPEVCVPEVAEDPAGRVRMLRSLVETWSIRITDEDRRRSEMYIAERERKTLQSEAVSIDAYLSGLKQELFIAPVDQSTLARVAQLHARTNQFNLTTERLSESSIEGMLASPDRYLVLVARAVDKFGDHGLVATAIAEIDGGVGRIRTFMMSCRVIGRLVEDAFLAVLLQKLRDRGVVSVRGRYIPTTKNMQVADFYRNRQFELLETGEDGSTQWVKSLSGNAPELAVPLSIMIHA